MTREQKTPRNLCAETFRMSLDYAGKMGNAVAAPGVNPTDMPNRRATTVIGYKKIHNNPTSGGETDTQTAALTPVDLQWKYYVKTYREGDPELPEDPAFPQRLVEKIQEREFKTGGDARASGSYILYPDGSKPKMWVGQYRCLNPEDLLTCGLENGCAVGEVMGCFPASGEEERSDASEESGATDSNNDNTGDRKVGSASMLPPMTCGLMRSCLQPSAAEGEDSEQNRVQNLRGGQSYFPAVTPLEKQLSHAVLQHSMKQRMAVATGCQFAHENLSSRLSFAQKLFSNDLPAIPVDPRACVDCNNTQAPSLLAPHVSAAQAAAAAMIPPSSPCAPCEYGQTTQFLPSQQQCRPFVSPYQTTQAHQHLQPGLLPPVLFSPPTQTSTGHPPQPTVVR